MSAPGHRTERMFRASLQRGERFDPLDTDTRGSMSDVHVRPLGEVWALEVGDAKHWSFDTQDEAVRRGERLAEQEHGELVIHRKDGLVREKDSHRNDPRSIPG
jgi:hypothetical protein